MNKTFSRYEVILIAILAFLQFTIILDFMVLSPLSAILLTELNISTSQFGLVVSAYAWSAGVSGLLAAGFADRYDRKKMLLFVYSGFILGTLFCGLAPTYKFLLIARIVTGIFGGIIGSITFAIVADTFSLSVRGRVMGFLQMAFAGASVLGLPIGLFLANEFGWHSPFLMIVGCCVVVLFLIINYVQPVAGHLAQGQEKNAVQHLMTTVTNLQYVKAFSSSVLIAIGGFMLMPFGSAFAVNNLGVSIHDLPKLYFITGICAMITTPALGKLSDTIGKYAVFCICSIILIIAVVIYSNFDQAPFWLVVLFSIIMFASFSGRMVSSSALLTAIPESKDRGAFMSINSAANMVSGGIASLIAGAIVYQTETGIIENYDILAYVVSSATIITMALMYMLNNMVKEKQRTIGVEVACKQ
jgi:predicted MFS family arabinose efflux permease